MNAYIGERYQLCRVILHLSDGILYEATDLSLKRDVFIYLVENQGQDKAEQCKKAFGQISHFSNNRFFHMLNAGTSNGNFFVVFTSYSGMPLAKYIQQHALSVNKTLSMVYEVGKAIQDALEANITNFSVSVDNLWITEDHHILVTNYWSEASSKRYGTYGLCDLLYQLSTLHFHVPQYYEMYETRLSGALKELSPGQKDTLLSLVQSVHLGESALFSFMVTLREIIGSPITPVKTIGGIYTPPAPKVNLELLSTAEEETEEAAPYEVDGTENAESKKMMLIITCAAVFIFVLGGAVLWANSLSKMDDTSTTAAVSDANNQVGTDDQPSVSSVRETGNKTESSDGQSQDRDMNRTDNSNNTSVSPPKKIPKKDDRKPNSNGTNGSQEEQSGDMTERQQTIDQQNADGQQQDPNTNSADIEPQESDELTVPHLVGLSTDEAGKLLVSSGLKYGFVLENTDEQVPGKVFKQEIPAGEKAKKGDKIIFYVSRVQD